MSLAAAFVAGEASGDLLAARVIEGLRAQAHDARFMGIGGPAMAQAGMQSWHAMDALSIFGYAAALRRLPSLIRIWRNTRHRILQQRPDVFVGVDAPDFNLRLEESVRAAGIPTVHFVSPSIWAWRFERIHQIRRAVSHMLVLFPFEADIYREQGIPVTYVGHPLAALIPEKPDQADARRRLGLARDARVLAVLPGSRDSEIRLLGPRFLQAVQLLQRQDPELQILLPLASKRRQARLQVCLQQWPIRNCHVLTPDMALRVPGNDAGQWHRQTDTFTSPEAPLTGMGNRHHDATGAATATGSAPPANWPVAWHAMAAADAVLAASGTATLEAALFKRPMVISYVLSPWMRRLMAWRSGQQGPGLPWVGLPNILLQDFAVPELLQEAANAQALAKECMLALNDSSNRIVIQSRFLALHRQLALDTPAVAARVILEVAASQAQAPSCRS